MEKTDNPKFFDNEKKYKFLQEKLAESSFKIKPILLELVNYNHFHSVSNKETDDVNNRFLGRKDIINRLKSFIHETNKNTGAYLVSGFRGMGKTSVVNKALATLNPKSKFHKFFVLWLLLLPIVAFKKDIIKCFVDTSNLVLLFLIIPILYLGYRDLRRPHEKVNTFGSFFISVCDSFIYGLISLFSPKLQKHKYGFQRILRYGLLYIIIVIFQLNLFNSIIEINQTICNFFWFTTYSVIIGYFVIDITSNIRPFIQLINDKMSFNKLIINVLLIFTLTICLIILICYIVFKQGVFAKVFFGLNSMFFSVLIFYSLLKLIIKLQLNRNSKKPYTSVLGRLITFLDLQHYLTVRVNLGKDSLTEKDVLKYVTNELHREYKAWYYNYTSIKRIINVLFLSLLLYAFAISVNTRFFEKTFLNFSLEKGKIAAFFPSQALLILDNENTTYEKIKVLLNENKDDDKYFNIDDYIRLINKENKHNFSIGYNTLKIPAKENIYDLKQKFEITNQDVIIDESILVKKIGTNVAQESLSQINKYELKEQSYFNKAVVNFAKLCNLIDFYTFKAWHRVQKTIKNDSSRTTSNIGKVLFKFYPNVPFLGVYFFMFLFVISYRFVPSKLILLKTHYLAIRDLELLKKQIDASIVVEKGGSANAAKSSIFSYLKRTSYEPLESKDITQRLIHILDNISKINPIYTRLHFVFVFDELDKINAHHNTVISNIEDQFDVSKSDKEVRYGARRKERISSILSGMKHFLNSANAKFIFIAGREMYDAALAGISDRESNLDSIFNDNKIYVNSFYKETEDDNLTDITSITEQYLCQFLIPESFLSTQGGDFPSLIMYNRYLDSNVEEEERNKIIGTLKDFVVYLTYRSNGAPRKLSSLIEQYIIPVSKNDLNDTIGEKIIVGNNDENLFLRIGYYDQYKFSLISYLTSPIFLGLGNTIHEYSDKLLVSISYMLDHLFKHHKFGISYRGLSLTPEIVDINKEPQFREFLDKLVTLMSKSHLRPIVSGIYDFKFHGKIEAEIKLLSKVNELEAAAFNFTLDESIELKRHFNKRLEVLKDKNSKVVVNNNSEYVEDYVNNISLLHMMIGDLHFYDEEFHEAIVHYLDAIQVMRQRRIQDMNLYDFVLFVRNKLKLGLAFEKNQMYDNALMTFSELTDLIIRKRNIPLRKLGLARFIIKREDIFGIDWNRLKIPSLVKDELFKRNDSGLALNEIIVIGRLKTEIIKEFKHDELQNNNYEWKKLYDIEDMETYYGINPKEIISNLDELDTNYKPLKHYFQQSTSENVRVLYQPIIAKLHLIEKASPDKLKDIDIIRAIQEINFIELPLKTNEKRVIISEFYNKVGDLLYFKNGTLNKCLKKQIFNLVDSVIEEVNSDEEKEKNKEIKKEAKKLLIKPIDATLFYIKSLAILLVPIHEVCDCDDSETLKIIDFIEYYNIKNLVGTKKLSFKEFFSKTIKNNLDAITEKIILIIDNETFKERYTSEFLFSVANGIIDLAEALMSFAILGESNVDSNKEHEIISTINNKQYLNHNFINHTLGIKMEKILNLYDYASRIFESIGDFRLARSQKLKILYVLKNANIETLKLIDNTELSFLNEEKIENIINDCITLSYATHNYSFKIEEAKLETLLTLNENSKKEIFKSGVIATEVEEVITIYWMLYKKFQKPGLVSKKESFFRVTKKSNEDENNKNLNNYTLDEYLKNSVSPYSYIKSKNSRILTLCLLIQRNDQNFKAIECDIKKQKIKLKENINNKKTHNDKINEFENSMIYIVLNSIGACNEIIKSHNLFGINYVTTSNFEMASAHFKMAEWCKRYEDLKEDLKKDMLHNDVIELDKILREQVLNTGTLNYFQSSYYYNLAKDYYNKAIDFHTRGNTLQNFIKTPSYLDDFFNDNLIHFSISVERNKVQENVVKDQIIEIEKKNSRKTNILEDYYL